MSGLSDAAGVQSASQDAAVVGDRAGVSVIIVTYHNAAVITQCLAAVAKVTIGTPVEVVVVDNASSDKTVELARTAAPEATIIVRSGNGGFSVGCAAGADAAHGGWLLFLNPDTQIAPDAIDELLACAAQHPGAGIFGGRFVPDGDNEDPSSWWGKPTVWSAFCFATGLSTVFAGNRVFDPEAPRQWRAAGAEVRTVPVICGAFMLIRRDLWDRLGGFDPVFFMYGEDADFCLRAARIGERAMVSAEAVCHHAGGKSSTSAGKLILLFTGKSTLIRRHFRPGLRGVGVGLLLTGVLLRAGASKRLGLVSPSRGKRPTASGEDWQALWDARASWRGGWTGSPASSGT
ncbi:MAG TPA: glycosyltransferase family 2 protein [Streptosporangiaceae bacterium]